MVYVTLKAAGIKGSVDSLRVSDVVDLANIALNIDKEQWNPWEIPDNPLKMHDLYNAQIKEPAFYFVSPGASDPDLKCRKVSALEVFCHMVIWILDMYLLKLHKLPFGVSILKLDLLIVPLTKSILGARFYF